MSITEIYYEKEKNSVRQNFHMPNIQYNNTNEKINKHFSQYNTLA